MSTSSNAAITFLKRFFAIGLILNLLFLQSAFAANAVAASYSLNEDTTKIITLRGGGSRNETVSYAITSQPSNGSVSLNGNMAVYTPNANFNGIDSFYFTVTGSSSGAASAKVSLTVNSVNDAPIANSTFALNTVENATVSGQFGGTDVDGDVLQCYAVSGTGGSFSMNSATCVGTFTPSRNFVGTAYAYYRVYDGHTYSTTVGIPVAVTSVNEAPVAVDFDRTLNEDYTLSLNLQASDGDGDALIYTLVTNPSHGAVVFTDADSVTYTPAVDYNGTDQFTYQVTDGTLSDTAEVNISITALNDAPVPTNQTLTTDNLTPLSITLQASDVDGDALVYSVRSNPAFGTLSTLSGDQVTFTPTGGYEGSTSFNFSVSDGVRTVSGTVTVEVSQPIQEPEITVATVREQSVGIRVPSVNAEGDSWSVYSWGSPAHGSLTKTSSGWAYTPAVGFEGMDSFAFVLLQGSTYVDALARINVTPPTGISKTPIVQLGLNFLNLNELDYLDDYEALGVQAVRQVGDGDAMMGVLQISEGRYRDPAEVAAVREQYNEAGIQVVDTLYNMMFASCGTDPDNPVETLTEECRDYVDYAAAYIDAVTPAGLPVYFEAGNELFHWVTHPDFTVEEQAMISAYAVDEITRAMAAVGREAVWYTPSIMIDSDMTWDWWHAFTDALDTSAVPLNSEDLIYQNYHYYSSDDRYLNARSEFEASGMWEEAHLMVLTEFGFSDDPNYERHEPMDAYEKAAAMVRLMFMAYGAGDSALYYHTPIYSNDPNNEGIRATGLIDEDGTWEPAAYSYQFVANELLPFTQITDLSQGDQRIYQVITAEGSTMYVVWGEGSFMVPDGITRAAYLASSNGDLGWSTVSVGATFALSEWPRLLR